MESTSHGYGQWIVEA
uniref:Uncharacterized protein n=1 Tax=Moniliophthora roreri TaxID=221103 RepID=A0A0W0GAI8_MONRR